LKSIGVVRKIDELGRVVIPKEIRDMQGIGTGTPMEFYIREREIIIKKYNTGCNECGEYTTDLVGKANICRPCAKKLANS
jgi:AbrB family transcriptional regulator, transcriptional pleiotropic regulator of transition state genes